MKSSLLSLLKKIKSLFSSYSSPWTEYEELRLLPLESEFPSVQKTPSKPKNAEDKKEALSDPHVADLSNQYPNPPLITCYTLDGEQDPNARITHYPPSNILH